MHLIVALSRIYWGKDCDGKFLCVVSLAGDFQSRFMQEKLSVKEMHIDLRRDASQNSQNLVLTLERQVDSDLFHTLCKSLVASLRQVTLPEVALVDNIDKNYFQKYSDRSSVRISSENQLETIEGKLYLVCFSLAESQENAMAMSLNNLVDKIAALLADKDVLAIFEAKLADYGYIPLPDYDSPKFFIANIQDIPCCDEFPKLVRSGLPVGIIHVNYQIELDKIESFACEFGRVLGDI
ncbi:MAG: PD-(D/E)XK motif protein [Desulfovibrio sp.]|nr:PD-(D/E)XK motif protein [Desulfovibrio sp.]